MMEQTVSLTYSHDGMNALERAIKRCSDFVSAFLGLVILSPLFLVLYVLLKKQGHGSVIFSQERIGFKGKPFMIYKFRTMTNEAENDRPQLVANPDEKKMSKLELFLRSHHLDELPQLYNVLVGDMSFVGPRPERRYFIDKIMERNQNYELIYAMRPGLTSEATLYNGYTDTMEKMLKRLDMDIKYLENRSLLLDVHIIFNTVCTIISGKKF